MVQTAACPHDGLGPVIDCWFPLKYGSPDVTLVSTGQHIEQRCFALVGPDDLSPCSTWRGSVIDEATGLKLLVTFSFQKTHTDVHRHQTEFVFKVTPFGNVWEPVDNCQGP